MTRKQKSFKIIRTPSHFCVMAVERNLLNSEGDDVCIYITQDESAAVHLCGKLNDALEGGGI